MMCDKHPKYMAKLKPRVKCEDCLNIYNKQRDVVNDLDREMYCEGFEYWAIRYSNSIPKNLPPHILKLVKKIEKHGNTIKEIEKELTREMRKYK